MVISTGLALAGLGAGLASGLANTATNIWSQKDQQAFNSEEAMKAREFNSAEAEKQRQWEEQMSSTAYQRAVSDMKAAGLNPASIGGSSPASTPSGAMANANNAYAVGGSRLGALNSSYFTSLLSSAMQSSMMNNKDYFKEVMHSMNSINAKQVAQLEKELYKATKNPVYDSNGGFNIL